MRHRILVSIVAWLCLVSPANAQRSQAQVFGLPTSDALFDDASVHEIRLRMSARDWDTLKARYDPNARALDYYAKCVLKA